MSFIKSTLILLLSSFIFIGNVQASSSINFNSINKLMPSQIKDYLKEHHTELEKISPAVFFNNFMDCLSKDDLIKLIFVSGFKFFKNCRLAFMALYPSEPNGAWMGFFLAYLSSHPDFLQSVQKITNSGKEPLAELKSILKLALALKDAQIILDKSGKIIAAKTTLGTILKFNYFNNGMEVISKSINGPTTISRFNLDGLIVYEEYHDYRKDIHYTKTFKYHFDGQGRIHTVDETKTGYKDNKKIITLTTKDRYGNTLKVFKNNKLSYNLIQDGSKVKEYNFVVGASSNKCQINVYQGKITDVGDTSSKDPQDLDHARKMKLLKLEAREYYKIDPKGFLKLTKKELFSSGLLVKTLRYDQHGRLSSITKHESFYDDRFGLKYLPTNPFGSKTIAKETTTFYPNKKVKSIIKYQFGLSSSETTFGLSGNKSQEIIRDEEGCKIKSTSFYKNGKVAAITFYKPSISKNSDTGHITKQSLITKSFVYNKQGELLSKSIFDNYGRIKRKWYADGSRIDYSYQNNKQTIVMTHSDGRKSNSNNFDVYRKLLTGKLDSAAIKSRLGETKQNQAVGICLGTPIKSTDRRFIDKKISIKDNYRRQQ